MIESDPMDEPGSEPEDTEAEPKASRRAGGKRIVLFGALLLLLIGGAAAGAIFSGAIDLPGLNPAAKENAAAEGKQMPPVTAVFYELPEMVVNLNSRGRRQNYLKLKVSLEVADKNDVTRVERLRPRIIDNFQVYLRELRIDDLRGSAGIYRLREELLARVNAAVSPAKVVDVLFKEILVQ